MRYLIVALDTTPAAPEGPTMGRPRAGMRLLWPPWVARKRIGAIASLSAALSVLPLEAFGRDLFEITVTQGGQTASDGFDDASDFFDQLKENELNSQLPDYQDTEPLDAELNIRGLEAFASFGEGDDVNLLTFQVPCSDLQEDFQGDSRDESVEQLRDFLEDSGNEQKALLQCLVSDTPVDPVAGNPNSLMAKMAASDFRVGTKVDVGENNLFGIGAEISYSEAKDFETTSVTLPLNYVYTIPNPSKPPYAVIVDAPVRYVNVQGADIWDGSIGLGLRVPIFNRWSLTPVIRAGFVGSSNTGTVQSVYSGSMTSRFDFYLSDLRLALNNMIGYLQTGEIGGGDFSQNYDVNNTIFRNGISAEGALNFTLFEEPTSWKVEFVDTRITGDDWFYNWYDEVFVSVGTRERATRMKWQDLRLGASYTFSHDFDRFEIVLNYRF